MKRPKKVAVIGLDCALTHLIDKHIAEGYLPTFKKLMEAGTVCDNSLAPFPTITPPNWTTICTGAWPATHQVTDYWQHTLGADPIPNNAQAAFGSHRNQAETIWEAAERAGKRSVVLNYPGSWPGKLKNGIVVGGAGLMVNTYQDGKPGLDRTVRLCGEQLISNRSYPYAIKGEFVDASGWSNVDDMGDEPLEMNVTINFFQSEEPLVPENWHLLIRDMDGDGYDTVTLSPGKNFADAYCTLKAGEWSKRIDRPFTMQDGKVRDGFFRVKLVDLDPDVDSMRLYISTINEVDGFTNPPEVARKLYSEEGVPGLSAGFNALSNNWIDDKTWIEINWQNAKWLADAATTLLKDKSQWDVFFMHSHPTDWAYHALMTELDPETASSPQRNKEAWQLHREIYETQDYLLEKILSILDEDTLVIMVSDHGATPDGPYLNLMTILNDAGLLTIKDKDATFGGMAGHNAKLAGWAKSQGGVPDVTVSKALPQRMCYVYVNLKGRDPHGVVDPADYEKVQGEIIDTLLSYVHPETGEKPVAMALTKKDARLLGLGGDQCGDVVYATKARYAGQHGTALPTGEYGIGTLKTLLTFAGHGIKKNYRMERWCNIIDLVPTVCYVLGIPVPKQCEGSVLYQLLEEPDAYGK